MAGRRIEIMFTDDEPTGRIRVIVCGQTCGPSMPVSAAEFNSHRERFRQLFQSVFDRGIEVGTANTQQPLPGASVQHFVRRSREIVMDEDKANATIARLNSEHYRSSDVLFVTKLKDKGLSVSDIAAVIDVLESVCRECLDRDAPCHCWNDE